MRMITEPEKKIPVRLEADVLVVGGGPAGIMSAQAATEDGLSVALVESRSFLGGNMTIGIPIVIFPPRKLLLSTSATLSPSSVAACADMIPAGPPPTTKTSASNRTGIFFSGSVIILISLSILYYLSKFILHIRSIFQQNT